MGRKPLLSVRVSDELEGLVEQYADEHDLDNADALRQVIRLGLHVEGYQVEVPEASGSVTEQIEEQQRRIEEQQRRIEELQRDQRASDRRGRQLNKAQTAVLVALIPAIQLSMLGVVGIFAAIALTILPLVGFLLFRLYTDDEHSDAADDVEEVSA